MPRHQQVVRQWQLLRRIERSSNGVNILEVAGEDAARQRAFYRDLEALQQAGFPLHSHDIDGQRRWVLTDTYRKGRGIPLSLGEILALRSARSALAHFTQSPLTDDLQRIIQKLDDSLSPDVRAFAAAMDEVFVGDRFGRADYSHLQPLTGVLGEARMQSVSVDVDYRSQNGELTTRRLDPYNIWMHRGQPYLIAWCHRRQAIRTFSLARMRRATISSSTFEVRPDYAFDDFCSTGFRIMRDGAPCDVSIWFAAEVALYVRERVWHATESREDAPGGALILHMRVAGLGEVAKWILSFGRQAKVLTPSTLVNMVKEELEAASKHYEDHA